MEALSAIFAIGTVWFILFTIVWGIILFYWVEKEFIVWSGFNVVIYLLFLECIVHQNVFGGILHHPIRTLLFAIGYLLIGFFWSFIKWWVFVNKEALSYKEKRYEWLVRQKESRGNRLANQYGLDNLTLESPVPDYLMDDWKRCVGQGCTRQEIPRAIKHKKTISHWVIYWPVSALWSALDDFMGKLVRIIIVKIRAIYDKMTAGAFKNTEELD